MNITPSGLRRLKDMRSEAYNLSCAGEVTREDREAIIAAIEKAIDARGEYMRSNAHVRKDQVTW